MSETDRTRTALAERYEIQRELGSGGMATVYLARDIKHDREVALKVLRSDLSAVIGTERFLAEVRITAKLDHPHILTLIDSGEADGMLFYVLPYVRGESLRAKLNREKQLAMDDAISIAKQVASALDYAHSKGVVHRDIKPENILLHEGEAVLADFGIALAVQEAGGSRLTETGLSLGTPQYMSPEQATGDRSLDKRSDIYSLAAVFYEMLAGEAPVTGPTAQSIIAKLITEKPVKLRVVRPAVPHHVEAATERGLAKTPADRFASAGEFLRALTTPTASRSASSMSSRAKWVAGCVVALALVVGVVWMTTHNKSAERSGEAGVRDRKQMTSTGNVRRATISPDGKSFAYLINECATTGCRFSIVMQDIGGTSRRLASGLNAVYQMEISADRRNVLFNGTYKGRTGSFLLSVLGGEPQLVATNIATFWAGSDSLLLTRATSRFDSSWIIVAGLDGKPADSIRIAGPADDFYSLLSVPGSNRIVVGLGDGGKARWVSMTRSGDVVSSFLDSTSTLSLVFPFISIDALWLTPEGASASDPVSIVRVPIDAKSGAFGKGRDTVYVGTPTAASITADGQTLMVDEGSVEYTAWAMSIDEIVKGSYTEDKRINQSTARADWRVSDDGKWVVIDRGGGAGGHSYSMMRYPSGPEKQIPGTYTNVQVFDSASASGINIGDGFTEFSVIDLTNANHQTVERVPQMVPFSTRMGKRGWAYRSGPGRMTLTEQGHKPRSFRLPAGFIALWYLRGNPQGNAIAFGGFRSSYDSLVIGVLSVEDEKFRQLMTTQAENLFMTWLDDGSLLVQAGETRESFIFYRVTMDGTVTRLGNTQRPTEYSFFSKDPQKAITVTRDQRGDAWTMKVVR